MIGAAIAAAAISVGGWGAGFAQPEARAVVWAVGDGADGSPVARRMARRIERDDPDAVLYLGDVYPSGSAADYARNYDPIYGALAPITWPTAGNHEWANRAAGYLPYWRRYGRAKPWYRFALGGWELIDLNSQEPHGAGSRQLRWLGRVAGERGHHLPARLLAPPALQRRERPRRRARHRAVLAGAARTSAARGQRARARAHALSPARRPHRVRLRSRRERPLRPS